MAQIKRQPPYRPFPPLPLPVLPNAIRFEPPTFRHKQQNDLANSQQDDSAIPDHITGTNESEQSLLTLTSSSHQLITNDLQKPSVIEESTVFPSESQTDKVLHTKHLPVYAQFPFDVSLLSRPMDVNIEDNIHRLRRRLIDSELRYQRQSTEEYIKRTQARMSLTSPTPSEYFIDNVRPPSQLVHQRIIPKILSGQKFVSIQSNTNALPPRALVLDNRIGMDDDIPNIEHELELRRIRESLSDRPSYDLRLHLDTLDEDQVYASSNVDDLIDSMARRHLTYRRLEASLDRQRYNNGYYGPYMDGSNTGRSTYRHDNSSYGNRTSRILSQRDILRRHSNGFNPILRSRLDYYNQNQSDVDSMDTNNSVRPITYTRLPPISPRRDSGRSQNNTTQHHQSQLEQSEHIIELPSDIFLSSRTNPLTSSRRTPKTQPTTSAKDTRTVTDRSDIENEIPVIHHQKKNSQHANQGFFTETSHQEKKKPKSYRLLFRKAAFGVLFFTTIKHRAVKNRSNHKKQTLSASIHKIRLQEILVGLHRVYLEPDGPIFNTLVQTINNPLSLENALNKSSKNYAETIQIVGNTLKTLISKITEFMPKDGVLGTGKLSAVSALIQDGNQFPDKYFWHCEHELLDFDNSKIVNITKQRAMLLLIGVFIFRGLVTTLLIKPIKYRLLLGKLTPIRSINAKVLASIVLYIGRRVAGPKNHILALPHEWHLSLYNDTDIQPLIQHPEIKTIINTCEQSLRMWCEEYIRRIDESSDKQLRT